MRDKKIYDWYIVAKKEGKAFTGLAHREYLYSDNWDEAKPLKRENTSILLRQPGTELIKTDEFGNIYSNQKIK